MHLCSLRDAMPRQWSLGAFQTLFSEGRKHPQGYQISQGYASTHLLRLLAAWNYNSYYGSMLATERVLVGKFYYVLSPVKKYISFLP